MAPLHSDIAAAIDGTLPRSAARVGTVPDAWVVPGAIGTPTAHVRFAPDHWIEVTGSPADFAGFEAEALWNLLRLNAQFGGCARTTLAGKGEVRIHAELYVEAAVEGRSLAEVVADGLPALLADVRRLQAPVSLDLETPPLSTGFASPPVDVDRIVEMCHEAGWPTASAARDCVTVNLDAPAATHQAIVRTGAASNLECFVPLTDGSVLPSIPRTAIAALLLGVTASVRMTKAVVVSRDGRDMAGLAVALGQVRPSAAEIDRALQALAVACCRCGNEVQALCDDALAEAYLAVRWPVVASSHSPMSVIPELEVTPCLQAP
jgi:hypothetical protein